MDDLDAFYCEHCGEVWLGKDLPDDLDYTCPNGCDAHFDNESSEVIR